MQQWNFLEPNHLLAHVVEQCPVLAEAFGRVANEHEPTQDNPWSLITAFDERVPGDKLKPHNTRKKHGARLLLSRAKR